MAYAAVVSLMQILENILHPHPCEHQIPWKKREIESLLESMACFHDFLARSWKKRSRVARCMERKIRDAAYKAEDVIESYVSEYFFAEDGGEKLERSKIFTQHLKVVVEEIESIRLKVTQLVDSWTDDKDLHHTYYSPLAQPSKLASSGDYTKVVFEDVSRQLMDQIVGGRSENLQIIPVVGMGGSGKTTLVKYAFQGEYISHRFDVSAWVTVSQNYRKRDILLGLLESMKRLTTEMHQESDEDLSECLYKCLKGMRYLIVMDDIWHREAWEDIKRLFPDDNMGSRVLLTTRLSDVATYANSSCQEHHLMRLLNENESWDLLSFKVFGDERSYTTELEEVGKKIARSCKGLPLSIVVISGLLSKIPRTLEAWESIAKNLNSVLLANDSPWAELLYFSYDHLPHHLKACFLYTGVFHLDLEIPISKLINLWIAEGFIKSNCSKSLEEVGEEYFDDLMSRNLILVGEKRFDGKIKTCVVHDLLREWCLSKALEEKFIHTLNANYNCQEITGDQRRLCIPKDYSDEALLGMTGTFPLVRSLLSQINPHDKLQCCKLLRVLDLSKVDLEDFPRVLLELVCLKYVSVCCKQEQEIDISEDLPDSLRNLQMLIIHQRCINSAVHLPRGIWRMQHLRHLQLGKCYFRDRQEGDKNSVLQNLQTLSCVSGWCCTKEFIQGIPNVKKLGIRFEAQDRRRVLVSSIRHFGKLHKLEILKCIVEPGSYYNIAKDLTLPRNLKKLTLHGTRISWKDTSIVGSLPNLEVLKLKDYACEGSEWEPVEGEFCRLKSLHIEGTDLQHWRAEKDHFPILERLILFECTELEEIPLDFVYLETLESIDLDDASPSAVTSAKQIQSEQQDLGNEVLKVCIHNIWQYINQKRKKEKERKEEMERRRIEEEDRRRAEEEEYRWKQYLWEEYKRRREAARDQMMREEDYIREEFDRRWREEEEVYLQNENKWLTYGIVPVWNDDEYGYSYEQSGSRADYERRRHAAEEMWRAEAVDRWRNGEDEEYLWREIDWKDYEWRTREALERIKREEDDRRKEFKDRWNEEEVAYLRKEYQWSKFHIVPGWHGDDHGNSYEQYASGSRANYQSVPEQSEDDHGNSYEQYASGSRANYQSVPEQSEDDHGNSYEQYASGSRANYQSVPEQSEDDHGNSYEQYASGSRANYQSVPEQSEGDHGNSSEQYTSGSRADSESNHQGSENSRSERAGLAGEIVTILLMLSAGSYGLNKLKSFWRS